MKLPLFKLRQLIAASLFIGALAGTSNAAIIMGTQNPNGSWSLGTNTFSLADFSNSNVSNQFALTATQTFTYGDSTNAFFWRRNTNFLVTFAFPADVLVYNQRTFGFAGSTPGDDNWLLLSLESGEQDMDTAIQLRVGPDTRSLADDAILGVYHDDSAFNEDITSGFTSFEQVAAAAVPEPSSAIIFGIGALGLMARRRRLS